MFRGIVYQPNSERRSARSCLASSMDIGFAMRSASGANQGTSGRYPGIAAGGAAKYHLVALIRLILILLPSKSSINESPCSSSRFKSPRLMAAEVALV